MGFYNGVLLHSLTFAIVRNQGNGRKKVLKLIWIQTKICKIVGSCIKKNKKHQSTDKVKQVNFKNATAKFYTSTSNRREYVKIKRVDFVFNNFSLYRCVV